MDPTISIVQFRGTNDRPACSADTVGHAEHMKQPLSFPVRVAAAVVVAVLILLAVPTLAHLALGSPVEIPIAWTSVSLICTALAALAGVALLAWRPPSGWTTILAAVAAAAVMTVIPVVLSGGWWQVVIVYLVVFGVYLACILAVIAAAAMLHGRPGLRFRPAVPASSQTIPVASGTSAPLED